MTSDNEQCAGQGKGPDKCRLCGVDEPPAYWCEVCERAVEEKRCPLCGLKARRVRSDDGRRP